MLRDNLNTVKNRAKILQYASKITGLDVNMQKSYMNDLDINL